MDMEREVQSAIVRHATHGVVQAKSLRALEKGGRRHDPGVESAECRLEHTVPGLHEHLLRDLADSPTARRPARHRRSPARGTFTRSRIR